MELIQEMKKVDYNFRFQESQNFKMMNLYAQMNFEPGVEAMATDLVNEIIDSCLND